MFFLRTRSPGDETKQDRAQAREHYRRAALGGDFRGQFNFARFLIQEGDILGAIHWLHEVPKTATPAFMTKMKSSLATLPNPEIADFLVSLKSTAPNEISQYTEATAC